MNQNSFSAHHYILEINREFIESSGKVKALPIHYDIPEDQLYDLLDQIDGVHLTGGSVVLYNFTSQEWHPYYITAKRIFNYATTKRQFLLTGICQGFEILSIAASGDKLDTMGFHTYDNVLRRVTWVQNSTSQIKRESRMFSSFDPDLLEAMRDTEITFHYHTFGIGMDMYPRLEHFFKVISTDRTPDNK